MAQRLGLQIVRAFRVKRCGSDDAASVAGAATFSSGERTGRAVSARSRIPADSGSRRDGVVLGEVEPIHRIGVPVRCRQSGVQFISNGATNIAEACRATALTVNRASTSSAHEIPAQLTSVLIDYARTPVSKGFRADTIT